MLSLERAMKQLLPLQNFRGERLRADLDVVEKAGEAAGRAVEVDADADAAVVRKREIRVAAQIGVQRDREVARGEIAEFFAESALDPALAAVRDLQNIAAGRLPHRTFLRVHVVVKDFNARENRAARCGRFRCGTSQRRQRCADCLRRGFLLFLHFCCHLPVCAAARGSGAPGSVFTCAKRRTCPFSRTAPARRTGPCSRCRR